MLHSPETNEGPWYLSRPSSIQVVLRLWKLLASGNLAELKVLDWTLVDANPNRLADGEFSNIPVFILTRS
jgi:hypothetical protein